jgi:hypothetical protein
MRIASDIIYIIGAASRGRVRCFRADVGPGSYSRCVTESYPASVFISYQHADKTLARALQDGLEAEGFFVWRDEAELRVGDSIVERVTAALDQIEFVAAMVSENSVTSPWCQKELALAMTGEIAARGVRVLPLRVNKTDMPPSLKDKLYLDVATDNVGDAVQSLAASIRGHLQPIRQIPARRLRSAATTAPAPEPEEAPIRVIGIDRDDVGTPRGDGSPGSALYVVPLILSRTPSRLWATAFSERWNHALFSTMHRPGIGSVRGDRIILDGTTVEEVAQHHLQSVKQAIDYANDVDATQRRREADAAQRRAAQLEQHSADVDDAIRRMGFDV